MLIFASAIVPDNLIQFIMSNLVFNPFSKEYFKARACVAISRRYNYAGSFRSYKFDYLCFYSWSSSYRAAFHYVLGCLEGCAAKKTDLCYEDIFDLFSLNDSSYLYIPISVIVKTLSSYFSCYSIYQLPVERLSYVYLLLEGFIRYNLGDVRFDLVSPMFDEKSAIRYVASKYFPDTSFIEIESDFLFKNVMD